MKTEYKVVPAPERATKQRGLKGAALFAHSVEALMNELAAEGWQYLRADTLPQEERSGLTNRITTYRNLLVFQRSIQDDAAKNPAPSASAKPKVPQQPGPDDDIVNLWESPEDAAPASSAPARSALVAQRQGKGVDL